MRTCAGIAFLLCVVGLNISTDAAPPKPPAQTALDADQLTPGVFTGTLVSAPNSDRMITVNVTYQKLQLKPGQNLSRANQNLQRQYNHIMQLQNQLMRPSRRHNPMSTMQQLQNAMARFQVQLAQTQANMFQVVNATQKVDFQLEENVKVRIKDLPEQFDEKGNIKRYTPDELRELKGKDKSLPGYESVLENLKVGQVVQVTLAPHKKPRPARSASSADTDKDKPKESGKDKAKETEHDAPVEHKLQVRMIVILKDNDSASSSPKK
jgi:hypothetical protein